MSSLYKITGTVSIKCTGNAYFEGSGVVTLGFRFENCNIFWSNNVAWTKVGCTKWNWENYKSLIMLIKHGAGIACYDKIKELKPLILQRHNFRCFLGNMFSTLREVIDGLFHRGF